MLAFAMDRAEGDTFHYKAASPKPWATNEELADRVLELVGEHS